MRIRNGWALCATCALGACAGNGDGLDENGRPEEDSGGALQPTFQSIQDNVFTPACTGCHAGAAAPLGLRLDEGASYALLVNAPSVEVPALQRVQPGNPDTSYLIQKLEGTAAVGGRMPLNGPPLPAETIAVVRQWITNGAPGSVDVGSAKPSPGASKLTAVLPADGGVLPASIRGIVIASSTELDAALLQAGVITLHSIDDADGPVVPIDVRVRSEQPAVLVITPLRFDAGIYELRISGGDPVALTDIQNRPIDGDGDGVPGGDFVLHFSMEAAR